MRKRGEAGKRERKVPLWWLARRGVIGRPEQQSSRLGGATNRLVRYHGYLQQWPTVVCQLLQQVARSRRERSQPISSAVSYDRRNGRRKKQHRLPFWIFRLKKKIICWSKNKKSDVIERKLGKHDVFYNVGGQCSDIGEQRLIPAHSLISTQLFQQTVFWCGCCCSVITSSYFLLDYFGLHKSLQR